MQIEDIWDAYKEADKVDFLNEEEKVQYATMLFLAAEWGRKKTKENKEYFRRNRLVDKYTSS